MVRETTEQLEGKVAQMPRGVAKNYKPLDLTVLESYEHPTETERAKLAPATPGGGLRQPAERSPLLVALDERNKKLYEAWTKAGKPAKWEDVPVTAIGKVAVADKAEAESMRMLLQGSTRFLGYGYQFGADKDKDGNPLLTGDGRHVVSWVVKDKKERKPREKKSE